MSLLEFRRRKGAGPDRCPGGGAETRPWLRPKALALGPEALSRGLTGLGTATWSAAPMERAAARLLRGSALVSALAPDVLGVGATLALAAGASHITGPGSPLQVPGGSLLSARSVSDPSPGADRDSDLPPGLWRSRPPLLLGVTVAAGEKGAGSYSRSFFALARTMSGIGATRPWAPRSLGSLGAFCRDVTSLLPRFPNYYISPPLPILTEKMVKIQSWSLSEHSVSLSCAAHLQR